MGETSMQSRSWNCVKMLGQVLVLALESPEERSLIIICVEGSVGPEVTVDVVCFSQELNPGFYPTASLVGSNIL